MFRLELDVHDLAGARFTISPLHETVSSLWPVYARLARPVHGGWAAAVRANPGIDHELLASMVSPREWIPDFVAPPPPSARPAITGQLAQVRETAPDKVIADILAAYGPAPLPACLRGIASDPAGLRTRVADALERYWNLVIAPVWPRALRLLEADVLNRGLQLAQRGPSAAIGGLDRRIRWDDRAGAIDVNIIAQWRREIPVAGRGLRFVPTVFSPFPNLPIDTVDPPVLVYPARASATLWHAPSRATGTGPALGGARVRLLAMLSEPASTASLASRLGVTPSAVSQHLHALAAAGLATSARAGRVVLYQQTAQGAELARHTSATRQELP
jgi:DNA-binding transcriptional ArsR family regulator